MRIKIKKGLDLPIEGSPEQSIASAARPRCVALLGDDYHGIRPKLLAREGEAVKLGQKLFFDKRTGVEFTSPASGIVEKINRGKKRAIESLVIRIQGDDEIRFHSHSHHALNILASEKVRETLLLSGLWTAFRTRPYSMIAHLESVPHSIFITATDTNPLAADPAVIINEYEEDFVNGLLVVARLADVPVYLCTNSSEIGIPGHSQIIPVEFAGPHPAGLVGTHIHHLDPASAEKTVWHINYQDVIAIGKLFTTGRIWVERIVSLAGPGVIKPRLLRMRLGADLNELVREELHPGSHRLISGSVLSGRKTRPGLAYLGRYHNQVTVVNDMANREFLGWLLPRMKRFAFNSIFQTVFPVRRPFAFDTSLNGTTRPIVPVGNFERVMPLDLLPTPLFKSLILGDIEDARRLGCLELDEEDLALCSYVCCSKQEYGRALRDCLGKIELENQ